MPEMGLEVRVWYPMGYVELTKGDFEDVKRIIKRQLRAELGLEASIVLIEEKEAKEVGLDG